MDIHSDIASIALDLIVILLLVGLWLLLMRALKLPRSVRSMTLDQARQRGYLNTAIISLMAGAFWIVAWATAQFIGTWGLAFLSPGFVFLVMSSNLDQARRRVFLNSAIISLIAGALWIVAWATAQFIGTWRIAFLGLGIAFLSLGVLSLIKGLRWKAGETP